MRRKIFRRSLFSDSTKRRKIFSQKRLMCSDCKYVFEIDSDEDTSNILCPNCGSDRFELLEDVKSPRYEEDNNDVDKAFSEVRRKLFSSRNSVTWNSGNEPTSDGRVKEDQFSSEEPMSTGSGELDEFLAAHSGQTIKAEDVDAELYARGIYDEVGGAIGLVDKGLASADQYGQVSFSETADAQMRLFSKLVISVTKEFDIDPRIDRDSVIDSLSERIPERGMMILRKYQVQPESVSFSDKSYLKDSGIEGDLSLEYGGTTMSLKDFMKLLSEEYPDAPDDIIDQLESSKTIKVNGGKVLIN